MAIYYFAIDVKFPSIKRRNMTNWIKQTILKYKKKIGNIAYIFCSSKKIKQINICYLNHYYYTDIITFDYSGTDLISGDLFISLEMVEYNSKKFNLDYSKELCRVIIHGILHLCGVNDRSTKEKNIMRKCENQALKNYDTSL